MGDKLDAKLDKAWADAQKRLWKAVSRINSKFEEYDMNGIVVKELRIQGPEVTGNGYRAIIKGRSEDGRLFVSFHDGESVDALLTGLTHRDEQGMLKWRDDLPYNGAAGFSGTAKKT